LVIAPPEFSLQHCNIQQQISKHDVRKKPRAHRKMAAFVNQECSVGNVKKQAKKQLVRSTQFFCAVLVMVLSCIASRAEATTVRLQTTQGTIEVELYDTQAPITVANFLRYVRSGAYNQMFFHRSVPGFVIQGGGFSWNDVTSRVDQISTFAPIQNEFSSQRSNVRGTIAMAKVSGDPNSATSQFFINLVNNASGLDGQNGGFTVFGRVTDSTMPIVDAIAALPRYDFGGVFAELPTVNYTVGATVTKANLIRVNKAATKSVAPGAIDIDGDGRQEILVRNTSGMVPQLRVGRLVSNQLQFTSLDDPGANYRIVGVVDADGNGKSDLAFLNTAQGDRGDVLIWNDFNRATERVWRQVRTVWDVQATGDFDGEGRDDVVWRYLAPDPRDTGVSFIWFQEGPNPQSMTSYLTPGLRKRGGAPLDWSILGAADFNADGAADLVYLSPDGQIRILMATPGRTCANFAAGSIPTSFQVQKIADFTGAGRADVLIRNPATGQNALRLLSATGVTLPPFVGDPNDPLVACTATTTTITPTPLDLPSSDPAWRFYAAADLNGDGYSDIVWLRPDGTLTVWLLGAPGVAPTVIDNAGAAPIGFRVFQPGGEGATYFGTPPASVGRAIAPVTTDASINLALESHIAINPEPNVTAARKLFVFLPGTGGIPQYYREILRVGAARGYHAIGLNYPNDEAIGNLCGGDSDVDCHGKAREEVITGQALSDKVDVNTANSIVNRLAKLISYLDRQYPNEGWAQFLNAGQPQWSRITMSGHSQGAGHAGLMAKLYTLDRAVYFSSPADWRNTADVPATWITARPNLTPASRQYGFTHLRDNVVPYVSRIVPIWQALGLAAFGPAVSVDSLTGPLGGTRQLTTNVEPVSTSTSNPFHGAPIVDTATPRATDGSPLFTPVWAYLAFPTN
jgi:cyclophilin family peptidyl-prolyl cis-trans isomerase